MNSRLQRQLHVFFHSAPRIGTSGQNRLFEHAQSNHFVYSANQICQIWQWVHESRLLVLEAPRGLNAWCWLKGSQPLGMRMMVSLVFVKQLFEHAQFFCIFSTGSVLGFGMTIIYIIIIIIMKKWKILTRRISQGGERDNFWITQCSLHLHL